MILAIVLLSIIFLVFTIIVLACPQMTALDILIIEKIQLILSSHPPQLPVLVGCQIYYLMLFLPLIFCSINFIRNKKYFDIVYYCSVPLFAWGINTIVKNIIQRPRPPFNLVLFSKPHDGFSYVSNHTLISFCVYGMFVYYLFVYCKNKFIRLIGITVSALWIIVMGLSRVELGAHYPSDVAGASLLGIILLLIFIFIRKNIFCNK